MITPTRTRSLGLERFQTSLGTTLVHLAHTAADRTIQAFAHFSLCLRIARERRQLRGFDTRSLKDIGLSRADAHREADRGFWDIPDHRRSPRGDSQHTLNRCPWSGRFADEAN